MNKDEIYEALCDIAEEMLTTPDELIAFLAAQGERISTEQSKDLPPEVSGYLKSAKAEKQKNRAASRAAEKEKSLDGQIKAFRELFPDVSAEDIPESVFEDMKNGIPLVYAYALYLNSGDGEKRYAESVNARNSRMATPPVNESDENGELSMAEVEAMNPKAVKSNFGRILKSIGKWKLN